MEEQAKQTLAKQAQIAERLQTKWLKRMEKMLDDGEITSTDMATLYRFFSDNGWTVDLSKMPKNIQDMLGELPPDFDEPVRGHIGPSVDTGTDS